MLRSAKALPISRATRFEELPELLTVPELAIFAGVGTAVIYDGINRGDIKVVKLGRIFRVPRRQVAAWLGIEDDDAAA